MNNRTTNLVIIVVIVVASVTGVVSSTLSGDPTEPLQVIASLLVVSALAGSRIFYLAEHRQTSARAAK